jgi:hypothetical protein
VGIKIANNAVGTLVSGITSSSTSVVLGSGEGAAFPALAVGDYFYATLVDTSNVLEIVKVTARAADTLTVVRGQDGTTAREYGVNSRLELRLTAAVINELVATDGTKLDVANPTYTGSLTGGAGVINIGSGQLYKDALGNLGVGRTTGAWGAGGNVELTGAITSVENEGLRLAHNLFFTGVWRYRTEGVPATLYTQDVGGHTWYAAPEAPAANDLAELEQVFRIAGTGQVYNTIPGESGVYSAFSCRAWASFNGVDGVSIRGSGNISSIVRNATGAYTINLSVPMPDTEAAVFATAHYGLGDGLYNVSAAVLDEDTIQLRIGSLTTAAAIDAPFIYFGLLR